MPRITRILAASLIFLVSSTMLVSCGGDGGASSPQQSSVVPLYSANGINWNDYVTDDGVDSFNASDSACNPAIDNSCLHSGQMRSMDVPGQTSCVGLTAGDSLLAFEWTCDASVNPVRFISTSFKQGKGLADLIDFAAVTFLDNALDVTASGSVVANSTPDIWWNNTIVVNDDGSDGTTDMNSGEIQIITQNANATYSVGVDRVALVVKPGVTLTGSPTTNETIMSANNRNFVWLEGVIDATDDKYAINLSYTGFSVLHNVDASNATDAGVYLVYSSNNNLSNITASGNVVGVWFFYSSNNSLNDIASSGNTGDGIHIRSSLNNSLSDITASGNGFTGIRLLVSSNNNILSNITASGSVNSIGVSIDSSSNNNLLNNITTSGNATTGVYLNSSTNNILSNITASGNSTIGVDVDFSSDNTLSNITASGNGFSGVRLNYSSNNNLRNITASGNSSYGVHLISSSYNTFAGLLQVGDNLSSYDCAVSGGTDPGLKDFSCGNLGSSNASLTTGVSVVSSFVDVLTGDYSLLDTDTTIRDIIILPTGSDTIAHTWSDTSSTVLLRNAVEIQGDSLGNDNLLCEAGETCLYTPNIAAYQGHGNLVSAGASTVGTLSGITLLQYETNGY